MSDVRSLLTIELAYNELVGKKILQKVPSNRLKIGQQVAYRLVVIASEYGRARQNSYGFRAI